MRKIKPLLRGLQLSPNILIHKSMVAANRSNTAKNVCLKYITLSTVPKVIYAQLPKRISQHPAITVLENCIEILKMLLLKDIPETFNVGSLNNRRKELIKAPNRTMVNFLSSVQETCCGKNCRRKIGDGNDEY